MRTVWLAALLILCGCAAKREPAPDVSVRDVTLPDGTVIHAELKVTPGEQQVGMMFRTELAHDRGMLFVNAQPQAVPYWMHDCNFPLDIIFIGTDHRVVEFVQNAAPCHSAPDQCPTYGGHAPARYVLEINGGDGAKHGVKDGAVIAF